MRIVEPHETERIRTLDAPRHVAIVMDGNRRWAAANGVPIEDAYLRVGGGIVSTVIAAMELGVKELTFFALAPKNLERTPPERRLLANLGGWLWSEELVAFLRRPDVAVSVVGEPSGQLTEQFPDWLGGEADASVAVRIAVNYSARAEADRDGSAEIPPVDLFIRTAGEKRLSDFVLLESAFAELVFTDTLWPDFRGLHLASAIDEFAARDRRFGR